MSTNTQHWQTLWLNVNLATMTAGAENYGTIENAALAVADGKIAWLGRQTELPNFDPEVLTVIDGKGAWLTPGLIDCHTHLVYGGNRANEFEMRLEGKSYQEIANAGGGIVSTVTATRAASESELFQSAFKRLAAMHQQGVTTIEIKSGYGLDSENEIKMLQVAGQLAKSLPVTVRKTFLGAHALPAEYKGRSDDYIDYLCTTVLPAVAAERLADPVDAFCEGIGFSPAQVDRVFAAAQLHDLPIKLHAEQLSDLKGAVLAAKQGALSVDHLEYLCDEDVPVLAANKTVAVLLPGAFYYLRETKLPPIAALRQHGVPIALATDNNPGSSPISSLPLVMNMACTLFRMTPEEALAGVTRHAAQALGLQEKIGTLIVGKQADLVCWKAKEPAELSYRMGDVKPQSVLFKGEVR